MTPPNPASPQEPGAGPDQPAPGFTFANKRKISPDGSPVAPAGGTAEPPAGSAPAGQPGSAAADGAGSPAGSGDTGEVAAKPDPNELLAAERLADLQRLQAEYANYRKRVDRDRAMIRDLAVASVIESLLPVLDDIHLARQHGDLEAGPLASIADKLETTLAKYGVERFGEPGAAFDPAVHDALMHVDEELAEGTEGTTVVGVLQPGYRIGDRVVRPARVSVADPK
ncbi:nucleotide exchange factor GrpE [Jatrophihabitans sp.]|uniref:nucleotide exchange factor GrpE n=1 Tax=Jatrophihabitans sp. TaxID=1932789 RepID=UPI002EE4BDB6